MVHKSRGVARFLKNQSHEELLAMLFGYRDFDETLEGIFGYFFGYFRR